MLRLRRIHQKPFCQDVNQLTVLSVELEGEWSQELIYEGSQEAYAHLPANYET